MSTQTPERLARVRRARVLRDEGWLVREIADEFGVNYRTVSDLLNDPDGSRTRARRDSYRGTCEVCGNPTDGSNGPDKAPRRCKRHNHGAEVNRGRAGTGPLQTWIVGLLRVNGPMRYKEIADASGTTANTAMVTIVKMTKAGYIRRIARGLYAAP